MALAAKAKRTPKVHQKRRAGQHHKHTPHYLKAYWPYLPLILVVVLGVVLNSVWGATQKGVLGYATDMSVGSLLQGTNQQRAGNALGALALNSELNQAAQTKANDMAARGYWSHNTPDGATPWTFITGAGYNYQTAGENLAYGFDTSSDTITGWMNSPEHRANILNGTYKEIGFGIANAADYQSTGPETIVVAMYASQQTVAATPAAAALPTPSAPTPSAPAAATPTPTSTPTSAPTDQPATTQPTETNSTKGAEAKKATSHLVAKQVTTQPITRIQLLASARTAPWSVFAISTIATVSIAIFLIRHGLVWRRAFIKGEQFVIKHKLLDVALVAVGVVGVLLTRTVGIIR
ncbi:MAG TPA: CAP domain-containing protein [Patescibacteria group bacterium]|nr:CAP domain-containing protein [Patescibacteria group bacterium]